MPALGDRFRAAREARGLTLSAVSEQIRIRSVYLAAIEEENWSTIGAPVYVRGFLRSYARFLGLDPEETVTAFNTGSPVEASARPFVSPGFVPGARPGDAGAVEEPVRPRRSLSALVWVAALVAVGLIALVVYNEFAPRPDAGGVVIAASSAPSPLPSNDAGAGENGLAASPGPSASPGTGSPSPDVLSSAGPNSLALVLSAPSWLRVTVDGSVSMEGTFPAGTAKTFHGKTALLRVGNAGGVEVYVDGKDVGKLGKAGDVVDRSFTL
jgi:cytoskeleton protein RodZ